MVSGQAAPGDEGGADQYPLSISSSSSSVASTSSFEFSPSSPSSSGECHGGRGVVCVCVGGRVDGAVGECVGVRGDLGESVGGRGDGAVGVFVCGRGDDVVGECVGGRGEGAIGECVSGRVEGVSGGFVGGRGDGAFGGCVGGRRGDAVGEFVVGQGVVTFVGETSPLLSGVEGEGANVTSEVEGLEACAETLVSERELSEAVALPFIPRGRSVACHECGRPSVRLKLDGRLYKHKVPGMAGVCPGFWQAPHVSRSLSFCPRWR